VPYELAVQCSAVQCSAVDQAVDYVLQGKYLESLFLVEEGNIFFYLRLSKKAKRRNNQN